MNTQDPKPGYLTTEFWTTAFIHLLSLIALVWTLSGHTLKTDHFAAVIPSAAVIASAVAQLAYSQSRAKTKAAHVSAFTSWVTSVSSSVGQAVTAIDNSFTNHVDTVGSTDAGLPSTVLAVPQTPAQPGPTDAAASAVLPTSFDPPTVAPAYPPVTVSSA